MLPKKIYLFCLIGWLILVVGISGCSTKVQTGERVICEDCGKVISDTVKEITVPKKEASKYKVIEKKGLCEECGNKLIEVKCGKIFVCEGCGKVLRQDIKAKTVQKKDRNKYTVETIEKGRCSRFCPYEKIDLERLQALWDRYQYKAVAVLLTWPRGWGETIVSYIDTPSNHFCFLDAGIYFFVPQSMYDEYEELTGRGSVGMYVCGMPSYNWTVKTRKEFRVSRLEKYP